MSVQRATISPKIKLLRNRLQHTVQLASQKAAAHLENPSKYPLPAGNDSLEHAITSLVNALPKRRRDKFIDHLKGELNATPAKRKQKYGQLASVDLKANTSIADQVKALALPEEMKLTDKELTGIKKRYKAIPAPKPVAVPGRTPRQAAPGTILQFAVENITCVETNDARKDEVQFSAFVVDSTGATQERNNFFSADFKKGDSKSPGAAGNLFTINLGDSTGGVFPATFAGGVLIVEEGFFGGSERVEVVGAIMRVVGKVIMAGGLVTSFFPAVGLPITIALIGLGAVVTLSGDILLFSGGDEISQVLPDELVLETPPLAGETFARTVEMGFEGDGFIKKGKYSVNLRWTVA